jgi:hypothetical protein
VQTIGSSAVELTILGRSVRVTTVKHGEGQKF